MSKYAERTKVPVRQSRGEIEHTLARYGATHFALMNEPRRAIVAFQIKHLRIRFDLPLPEDPELPEARRRWRALALVIKAKLEAVESGIETLEEAFLAHVILPDGETIMNAIQPRLTSIQETGKMVPLLPPPRE